MRRHTIRICIVLVALVSLYGVLLMIVAPALPSLVSTVLLSSPEGGNIQHHKILINAVGQASSIQQDIDTTWDPSKPQFVLIVGYYRVSSSFIGQLFNQNEKVFYLFEPVDGIYNDMYGTKPEWSVSTDIDFYPNTTARVMPEWEKAFLENSLSSIYTCNFSKAATGMIASKFLAMFEQEMYKVKPYVQCLKDEGIIGGYMACRQHFKEKCPSRFTIDSKACAEEMQLMAEGRSCDKDFKEHHACQLRYREKLNEKCLERLQNICLASPIRAAKTVRMSMETAGRLMKQHSNVKIIHLIRDPKSVVASRFNMGPTVHGIESNHVTEAKMYCSKVLKDVEERRRLEKIFPKSRFLQIFTDNFVHNTKGGMEELYAFLGKQIPQSVSEYVLKETKVLQWNNSVVHRDYRPKWHSKLSSETALNVDQECIEMYESLKPPWRNYYAL